ncbi:hypothetical protein HanHA300_Chr03g0083921 [Helianthus annuus]|nr:hypothetical protein HanHA300_Chr03g0083921 [Helianthus annuus]
MACGRKIPSYHLRSPPDSTSLATRPRNSLSWCTSMVAVFVSSLLSPSSPTNTSTPSRLKPTLSLSQLTTG